MAFWSFLYFSKFLRSLRKEYVFHEYWLALMSASELRTWPELGHSFTQESLLHQHRLQDPCSFGANRHSVWTLNISANVITATLPPWFCKLLTRGFYGELIFFHERKIGHNLVKPIWEWSSSCQCFWSQFAETWAVFRLPQIVFCSFVFWTLINIF